MDATELYQGQADVTPYDDQLTCSCEAHDGGLLSYDLARTLQDCNI